MEVVAMVLEGGQSCCRPERVSSSAGQSVGDASHCWLLGQDHRAVEQRAGDGVGGTRLCQIEHDDYA